MTPEAEAEARLTLRPSPPRQFILATSRGIIARFVRTRLVPLVVPWLFRLPPFRRFMFETLAQFGVNYRNSSLSGGTFRSAHII